MTVTDVMCNACFRQFLVGVTVEFRTATMKRSHMCHDCVMVLLNHLPVGQAAKKEVEKSWEK